MQDKFIEEIKGLKDNELVELYNKICDHMNYLESSIINIVDSSEIDEDDDEEDEDEEDLEDGGEEDGDE